MPRMPDNDRVDVGTLGPLKLLGSGGQGTVHIVTDRKINNSWPATFKKYKPEVLQQLDQDALAAMVHFLMGMSFEDGNLIFERAAWPWRLVTSGDSVTGFLMRQVPDEFYIRLNGPQGPVDQLAQVQHLLNDEKFLTTRGIVFDTVLRLEFLRDVAETLAMFHSLDIAVGDLSPRNLLFSARANPRCFFIDCDAMRLRSASALAQAETPEWMIPDGEDLATPAADMYKFSLLAIRLFAGDQFTRDTTALAAISPDLADLAQRGLSENPAERGSAQDWVQPLIDLIALTSASHTQVLSATATPAAVPPPFIPQVQNLPQKPRSHIGRWIAVAAALIAMIVILPLIFHGGTSTAANNQASAITAQNARGGTSTATNNSGFGASSSASSRPPTGTPKSTPTKPTAPPPTRGGDCDRDPLKAPPISVTHHATSAATITAVRPGTHPDCGYDRVTFDIGGSTPSYTVTTTTQVVADGSGQPISLPGTTFLLIRFEPARVGALTMTPVPLNYPIMRGYAVAGANEGVVTIALGLSASSRVRVGELSGRIYVDVSR